jgi:D-aspartate ligase
VPALGGPAYDTTVPALTLKVGEYVLHHGGLGIARSLGRVGVPVYGVHEDRLAPAGLSRYTTGRFVWPTGGQDTYQDQLLAGLDFVACRVGTPAVLIPTDDYAAVFMADHADVLRERFLLPKQSAALVREVSDKAALHERCLSLAVAVPRVTVITDRAALESFAATTELPIVVKRARPRLLADGRRATSTRVVHDRGELLRLDPCSDVLLLQEYLPPAHAEDWLFHAYCDENSDCLVAFTGRKLRSFPPGAGETAIGRAARNPVLEDQARTLLARLGYRGAVSMDYRLDRRSGSYLLLDLNPRVGAIFRLFHTEHGVDVIRAMHLDLTGRAVPDGTPVEGRVVVVEGYGLRSTWSQVRSRTLAARELWTALQATRELAWLTRDDLIPALVALVRAAVRAVFGRRWRTSPPQFRPGRAAAHRR